ncbi:regulatory protein RecX [Nitrospinota bacterium]
MSSADKLSATEFDGASLLEKIETSALRILALRSHTQAELRRKLHQRGFPHHEVEAVLGRLKQIGYLDDESAARSWVRRRLRSRPMGLRLMEQEFQRLGVSPSILKSAISEAYEEGAELEYARRAAWKRLKGLEGKDKLRERLLRFLRGRGFPAAICFQAADEALGGAGREDFGSNGSGPDEAEF